MDAPHIRRPAVAGRFYPGTAEELENEVRQYVIPSGQKRRAIGCVVPHAGYVYSGHVAGAVYGALDLPRRFIILCPNHTGMGHSLSMMSEGVWQTPLGDVPIDTALAAALHKALPALHDDFSAHMAEHAIEVQIPFLQMFAPEFTFVPITIGTGRYEEIHRLGMALAAVVKAETDKPFIVASSDMNHYESDDVTRIKDRKAVDAMLALDGRKLFETVRNEKISMCGFGPATAMLTAAVELGATKAELIKYATSADVSGDKNYCVGYAGIVVS